MSLNVKKMLSLFASLVVVIPLYIGLHEGGHVLIAVLCGAKITTFSVLGAHMSYTGGVFTSAALSLFYLAGMLLPVLVSIVYTLTYQRKTASVFYPIFSFFFLLIPTGSILAWMIVPVLCLVNQAPPNDDVTKFIASSGCPPWAVSLGAVILFAGCCLTAWRKSVIQNYWRTVKLDA